MSICGGTTRLIIWVVENVNPNGKSNYSIYVLKSDTVLTVRYPWIIAHPMKYVHITISPFLNLDLVENLSDIIIGCDL